MAQSEAKAPALLIDAMFGDLSRRLRWLGYDAEYRNDLPDEERKVPRFKSLAKWLGHFPRSPRGILVRSSRFW